MSRYTANTSYTANSVDKEIISAQVREKISSQIPDRGIYRINYGFDHAVGYFIQFFPEENKDTATVDIDTMFHGLQGYELAGILRTCLDRKNFPDAEKHSNLAILDLSF